MTRKITSLSGEPLINALLNFHAVKLHFKDLFIFIAIDFFFFATLSSETLILSVGSGYCKDSKLVKVPSIKNLTLSCHRLSVSTSFHSKIKEL